MSTLLFIDFVYFAFSYLSQLHAIFFSCQLAFEELTSPHFQNSTQFKMASINSYHNLWQNGLTYPYVLTSKLFVDVNKLFVEKLSLTSKKVLLASASKEGGSKIRCSRKQG